MKWHDRFRARHAPGLAAWIVAAGVAALGQTLPEKNDSGLPLPFWNEPAPGGPPLGGGLWPDDFKPGDVIHPALSTGAEAETVSEAESWLRFLPRSLFTPRNSTSIPEPPLTDMGAEVLHACENAPPATRMLDPQGLLTEAQTEDLARLLAFHSEHASVGAGFLLLDTRQKLPVGADLSRLASGSFSRGAACLVVYPLGAPRRARIFLTRSVTQVVAPSYLEALAAACIRDAMETPDPVEQLQRFATQLSIRLFWLERAHPTVKPEPVAPGPLTEEPATQSLSEVTPAMPSASPGSLRIQIFWETWKAWVLLGISAMLAVGLAVVMVRRWHQRRQRQSVWILPDYQHRHPIRFGGPHCGGNGVSVKYG